MLPLSYPLFEAQLAVLDLLQPLSYTVSNVSVYQFSMRYDYKIVSSLTLSNQ